MTSTVAIHLTETGLWAHGQGSDWQGSVGPAPIGVVDDRAISYDGVLVPVVDAWAVLFGDAVRGVGQVAPVDVVVVSCPSHWGSPRRDIVSAAARSCAKEVIVAPVSDVALWARPKDGTARRTNSHVMVLELGALSTTATYLTPRDGRLCVAATEFDPALGTADVRLRSDWPDQVAAVVEAAVDGGVVDQVLIVGEVGDRTLESLRESLSRTASVETLGGAEVAQRLERQARPEPAAPAPVMTPTANWLEPAMDGRKRSRKRKRPVIAAIAAVVALVAAGAVGYSVWHDRAAEPARTAQAGAAQTTSAAPAGQPGLTSSKVELDRVTFDRPEGWTTGPVKVTPDGVGSRIELTPAAGRDRRITVIVNPLTDGAGYDEVADDLQQRISDSAGSGVFRDLERDVTFGGRPGISYSEYPDKKSQVKWHVIVEHDMQVSLGCQFVSGEWDMASGDCEHVVESLVTQP